MHDFCPAILPQPIQWSERELATESRDAGHLRKMVVGQLGHTEVQLKQLGRYLAVNCETVEVAGPQGKRNSLARVTIVNFYGVVVLDTFVRQEYAIMDYRTQKWEDLEGPFAREVDEVRNTAKTYLRDRILVSHDLQLDLKLLRLNHPTPLIQDIWRHHAWREETLKTVIWDKLGINIEVQDGERDAVSVHP
ncbi:3'-5' exonuclease [Tulasnella sp. JGI-2019a]|nr:3'-5' exonuclease [Tulasnella sp. JGI-2019a]